MAYKTYVLTDAMNVSVPIFQRVNETQKVPIVKRPWYSPFLQITVQDENGVTKNLRYKESSDTIDLEEQIEKKKIPANAKYTNSERTDRLFRNGICSTNKVNLQRYLEAYPGFEGSPYTSDSVQRKEYSLYDKTNINKVQNAEIRKRAKAVAKVLDFNLEEAKSALIRLNGSFFETPNDLDECQNMLIEFVDAAEDKGLDAVLKEDSETTVDEKTTVLIGKLLNAGILSFDKVEGKISKLGKDGKWINIRDMSATYSLDERKRMLSDFLNTSDGKALKDDLENDLNNISDAEPSRKAKKQKTD